MNKILVALKHLHTINKHRFWVLYYCHIAGITSQGLVHDLSKYSPTEFLESIKYYTGTDSPINKCKEINGVSYAWMNHKGRNKHHYEYWQDNFDKGGEPIDMPYKYALEMICDYLAAGRAYNGKSFTYEQEYEWWINKISNPVAMHEHTKAFVDIVLKQLSKGNNVKCVLDPMSTMDLYEYTGENYER